jgi:hypothetical protein
MASECQAVVNKAANGITKVIDESNSVVYDRISRSCELG